MCVAFRNYSAVVDSRVQQIVRDMSATPVVWHGNGDGKVFTLAYMHYHEHTIIVN